MSEEREFVELRKVADHFKVSESTVRAWIRNGSIPEDTYIKVGKTFRFELNLISDALLGGQPKTNPKGPLTQDKRDAQELEEVDPKDVLADLDEDF